MTVKNSIQEKRNAKGLTRKQLADAVEINWETIKAYESKGAIPSMKVGLRIAKELDCSLDDLFTLEEQEMMQPE